MGKAVAHRRTRTRRLAVAVTAGSLVALASQVVGSGATSAAPARPTSGLRIPGGTAAVAAEELTAFSALTPSVAVPASAAPTRRSKPKPPASPTPKPAPTPKPKPVGYVNEAGPAPVQVPPITLRPGPVQPSAVGGAPSVAGPGSWTVERDLERIVHVFDLATSPTSDGYLACAGSGNIPTRGDRGPAPRFECYRVDRTAGTQTTVPLPDDWFCSAAVHDADGNVVSIGGTRAYPVYNDEVRGTWGGSAKTYRYHADSGWIERLGDMVTPRWYANVFKNEVGDIYVHGGQNNGRAITSWEVMRHGTTTWQALPISLAMSSYADMELVEPNTFAFTGASTTQEALPKQPYVVDLNTYQFRPMPGLSDASTRRTASALLTYPAQAERVMVAGGFTKQGRDATDHVDLVDLSVYPGQTPQYRQIASLPQPMGFVQMVNLPNGQIFATGGSRVWRSGDVLWAGFYDPARNAWDLVTPPSAGRDYHSNLWVNTDGTVSVSGGNPSKNVFESRVETYRPWYVGQERPTFWGLPDPPWGERLPVLQRDDVYSVSMDLPDNDSFGYFTLDAARASTHASSDPDQAMFSLPFAQWWGRVYFRIPETLKLTPGVYKLTVVTQKQVPSRSVWVKIV